MPSRSYGDIFFINFIVHLKLAVKPHQYIHRQGLQTICTALAWRHSSLPVRYGTSLQTQQDLDTQLAALSPQCCTVVRELSNVWKTKTHEEGLLLEHFSRIQHACSARLLFHRRHRTQFHPSYARCCHRLLGLQRPIIPGYGSRRLYVRTLLDIHSWSTSRMQRRSGVRQFLIPFLLGTSSYNVQASTCSSPQQSGDCGIRPQFD
jgi:hypothetical protein